MLIMPYDTESQSRNADFIGIALWAIRNPRANGPSNLRILRTLGPEARQPSHRRCVQRRSRIGGGERSEPIRRMLIMPYDTESQFRNADFISIALRAIRNPRANGPPNLRPLRPSGRSILRTFPFTTLRHNPRRSRAPFLLRRSRHHNPRGQRPRQT